MKNQFVILNSFGALLGPNSFAVLDDEHVSYICGRFICIYRTRTNNDTTTSQSNQSYIPASEDSIRLHALCASPSSSQLKSIAFAEVLCLKTSSFMNVVILFVLYDNFYL